MKKSLSLLFATVLLFAAACGPAADPDTLFHDNFSTEIFVKGELHILAGNRSVGLEKVSPIPPIENKQLAVKQMLETGINSYNLKDYDQAINQFTNFLEIDANHKNNAEVKFYLAVSHLAKNDPQAAKAIFQELIKKDNNHSFRDEAEWYLALTLLKTRELDEAKKLLKTIAKEKHNHPYQTKAKEVLSKIS